MLEKSYTCRRLAISDIDIVMDMNNNYRNGFICRDNAEKFLCDGKNWMFAAVSDGVIIGFCYGYQLTRLNDIGDMLYIHEVGVMEQFHRCGIGSRLIGELRDECRRLGFCRFFLFTDQNNLPANALYRKMGGVVSPDSHGDDTEYFFATK